MRLLQTCLICLPLFVVALAPARVWAQCGCDCGCGGCGGGCGVNNLNGLGGLGSTNLFGLGTTAAGVAVLNSGQLPPGVTQVQLGQTIPVIQAVTSTGRRRRRQNGNKGRGGCSGPNCPGNSGNSGGGCTGPNCPKNPNGQNGGRKRRQVLPPGARSYYGRPSGFHFGDDPTAHLMGWPIPTATDPLATAPRSPSISGAQPRPIVFKANNRKPALRRNQSPRKNAVKNALIDGPRANADNLTSVPLKRPSANARKNAEQRIKGSHISHGHRQTHIIHHRDKNRNSYRDTRPSTTQRKSQRKPRFHLASGLISGWPASANKLLNKSAYNSNVLTTSSNPLLDSSSS